MEPNVPPVIAKRIWSIVRVAFFMLRKGISKRKLMLDLNMMMKRGKVAGKAISNLMFHHHHHHDPDHHVSFSAPREYEFSCSNTPNYSFHINKRRHHNHNHNTHHHSNFFACAHAPSILDDDVATVKAFNEVVLEMMNNEGMVEASPALPGFGRSPMVRQLRITDSPFPLRDIDEDSVHVDKAAEEFIERFYKELRQQK
uniref:Avr9/Cf-9 rapidly elicited protein 146 n=1 Tax=Fagus sylvatica TaxID=28930 RepID=A0A2N9FQ26_FAGSY